MVKLKEIDVSNLIKPSLFPDEGAEAIDSYSIGTLTSENVWNHFELLNY